MNKTLVAIALLLGIAQSASSADDSEFQITPRIGQGELRIDAFEDVDENLRETDTYGLGIGFGVLTPIGVIVEVGADSQGNVEIFDDDEEFSLTQRYVAIGYQLELGDGWQIIPKVSRAQWKLRSDEGLFDFSDDNDNDEEMRGYEYVYEATLARKVSRVLTLGLNYKQGDFDFGKARALSFVVQIGI
jgi:hypothetical protein